MLIDVTPPVHKRTTQRDCRMWGKSSNYQLKWKLRITVRYYWDVIRETPGKRDNDQLTTEREIDHRVWCHWEWWSGGPSDNFWGKFCISENMIVVKYCYHLFNWSYSTPFRFLCSCDSLSFQIIIGYIVWWNLLSRVHIYKWLIGRL